MGWRLVPKADTSARRLADRHYSRRNPGSACFTPPGETVVLHRPRAVWASLRQRPELVAHAFGATAWVCSIFRNEGAGLSSTLIREAVAATRAEWGDPPPDGFLTFVDPQAVGEPGSNPGWCFIRAGWVPVGWTPGGHGRNPLRALRLAPEDFGKPVSARAQLSLLEAFGG